MTHTTEFYHRVDKTMIVYCIVNERICIRTFIASLCTYSFNTGCFALIILS
jgi:hypothetical protein